MAIEEHGAGKQLVRFRAWPRYPIAGVGAILLLGALSVGAAFDQAWFATALLGTGAAVLVLRQLRECAVATTAALRVREELPGDAVVLADNAGRPGTREAS
jgi:hypothetical protein